MTIVNLNTKICSRCNQEKSVSEFYKAARYSGGLKSECKKCSNERVNNWYVPKPIKEKNCVGCNSAFLPTSNNHNYCSKQCRKTYVVVEKTKLQENLLCMRCGNEFYPTVNHQKYCSTECRIASTKENNYTLSQANGLTKSCFTCGVEKPLNDYRFLSVAKYGVANHCKQCEAEKYRIQTYGENQKTVCEICGTEFKKENGKSFCSKRCRQSARTVRNGGVPQINRHPKKSKPVIDGKKECTICGEIRPLLDYYQDPTSGRYSTYCNGCQKIKGRVASRIRKKIDRTGEKLRKHLRLNPNNHHSLLNLDYSISELRIHLERQFTKGMSWEKFMSGEIHIDHIIPIVSFDLSNHDDWLACWALPNLRPLWAKDNLDKRAKILTLL